jgi:hypothetical protein
VQHIVEKHKMQNKSIEAYFLHRLKVAITYAL